MPAKASFSVRLPEKLGQDVARLAASSKRSRAEIVKAAVAAYVDDEQDWQDAIDEAVAEADKGVFISGEKVGAWLKSWGTDNPLPPPAPDIFPDKPK